MTIGDNITIKKYKLGVYFSQHIPIKIEKHNNNLSSSSNNSKNKLKYGGGYLLLNLSIPIN